MKKLLIPLAVISFIIASIALAVGGLFMLAHMTTLDGTSDMADMQVMGMIISIVIGLVLVAVGVILCVKRAKMK